MSGGDYVIRTTHNLLHVEIPNGVYSISFRTADSAPDDMFLRYYNEMNDLYDVIGNFNNDFSVIHRALERLVDIRAAMRRFEYDHRGNCILLNRDCASCVQKELMKYNHRQYILHSYAINANHVHLCANFNRKGVFPCDVIPQIKRNSACVINKILGRQGAFWQRDFFDCVVRSLPMYFQQMDYIWNNIGDDDSAFRWSVLKCPQGEIPKWFTGHFPVCDAGVIDGYRLDGTPVFTSEPMPGYGSCFGCYRGGIHGSELG